MATIKKRGNSYLIRCYDGYDQTGRQIERTMTWKIPQGMSDKKAERREENQVCRLLRPLDEGLCTGTASPQNHQAISRIIGTH